MIANRLFPPRGYHPPARHTGNGNGNGNGRHVRDRKGLILSSSAELFFDWTGKYSHLLPDITAANAYRLFSLTYACMRYRATKFIEPPLIVVEENEDGEEWLADHPLVPLLEQPNPDMGMTELLELVSLYLDATGRCLLVKNRDRGRRVASLYPFSGDEFTVESTSDRLYGRFRLNTMAGKRTLEPDDVIYFRNIDPGNLLLGMAPLAAALSHANIGHVMRQAVTSALRRVISPGGVVATNAKDASGANAYMPDDIYERFKSEVNQQFGGAATNGGVWLLENATFEKFESPLKEMALGPIQGDVETAVCMCFSIHPALIATRIGIENSASWSEILSAATRNFYDIALQPLWTRIEDVLTRSLLRDIDADPNRYIRFDTSRVRALEADMTKRTAEATAAAEYWTVNERRIHTGQDPLDEDDERGEEIGRQAPAGGLFGGLVPDEGRGDGPGRAPDDEDVDGELDEEKRDDEREAKARRRRTRRAEREAFRRQSFWALTDALARYTEGTILLLARQAITEDRDAIERIVVGSQKADPLQPLPAERAREIRQAVDAYLDGDSPAKWRILLRPVLEAASRAAAERAAAELGIDFQLLQPGLLKFVEKEIGWLVTNVSDTTREGVRREIAKGLEAGESVRQIADHIRAASEFSDTRATLIARTESARATNGAARESMSEYSREYGIRVEKEWVTARDARVRDEHQDLEGERRPVDEPFSNGLQYPGEPNCRCVLLHHTVLPDETPKAAEPPAPPVVNVTVNVPPNPEPKSKTVTRRVVATRNADGRLEAEITEVPA